MITADHRVFHLFCSAKWNKTLLHSKWQFAVSSSSPPAAVLICSGSSTMRRWKIMFNLLIKVCDDQDGGVRQPVLLSSYCRSTPDRYWPIIMVNVAASSSSSVTAAQPFNSMVDKKSYYHATATIQQKMSLPKWPIRLLDRWTDGGLEHRNIDKIAIPLLQKLVRAPDFPTGWCQRR